MHRAIRKQTDGKQEEYSRKTQIDFTGVKLITRQEDKQDADINHLLQRFGVGLPVRQPEYGQTIDYNLDLQTAMDAVEQAKQAWQGLPDNLRKKYPRWQDLLNAVESGNLKLINENDPETNRETRINDEIQIDEGKAQRARDKKAKRAAEAALREEDNPTLGKEA